MSTETGSETFSAIVVDEAGGNVSAALKTLPRDALPEGDVLVKVAYSSLNYKDGLALTGRNKVVRSYPMIPGIDFDGTVIESASPAFQLGDRVVLTGWGVGERHWGGFAQLARVASGWLVPVPEQLALDEAMAIGTAGFTAMLCIMALEQHGLTPDTDHEILVTGASGGVGSMAVALLAALGYKVAAATGKAGAHDYLTQLGASEIIDRGALTAPGGPLASARWGGVVDTVGGETLAGALRSTAYGTSVAACGNAGGLELHTTILPFILRSVSLLGIDSLPTPIPVRKTAWQRIATTLSKDAIHRVMHMAPLAEVPALAEQILAGKVQGRVVVDVNA